MKIELKFSTDAVVCLNQQLQNVYSLTVSNDKRENVYKSIGYDLADKFDKKCKTLIKKASLFDVKKRHKMSLKFHEAWALQEILSELVDDITNSYQKTLIEKIIHTLDQKTC